jgi:hypothetical protein
LLSANHEIAKCIPSRRTTRLPCLGLALESAHAIRISSDERREHLDGHVAVELRVVCSIDFTHSAGTERRHDAVRAECRTGVQLHGMQGL